VVAQPYGGSSVFSRLRKNGGVAFRLIGSREATGGTRFDGGAFFQERGAWRR